METAWIALSSNSANLQLIHALIQLPACRAVLLQLACGGRGPVQHQLHALWGAKGEQPGCVLYLKHRHAQRVL